MTFNSYWDDRATGALALARVGKQTDSPVCVRRGAGEYAVTGRLTCLPIYEDEGRRLLHLGIGYSLQRHGQQQFRRRQPPPGPRRGRLATRCPTSSTRALSSRPIPCRSSTPKSRRSSGGSPCPRNTSLPRDRHLRQFNGGVFSGPHGNVTYQGLYAEFGFFLTPDDYRRYDKKEGMWGRQIVATKPRRRTRALPGSSPIHTPVQLICRYSYLDLASGQPVLTPSSGTQAGWENDITAGFDWYINSQVHFMVNYVYTRLDYVNHTSGNIQGLGCRLHVDFYGRPRPPLVLRRPRSCMGKRRSARSGPDRRSRAPPKPACWDRTGPWR